MNYSEAHKKNYFKTPNKNDFNLIRYLNNVGFYNRKFDGPDNQHCKFCGCTETNRTHITNFCPCLTGLRSETLKKIGRDWNPSYGDDLESFLLDSYYKPETGRGNKLSEKSKRRLKYLGDFVHDLKYEGKKLYEAYVAAHPEEDMGEVMRRREDKKKQNAILKAKEKEEKAEKKAKEKERNNELKAAKKGEYIRNRVRHIEKLTKMGLLGNNADPRYRHGLNREIVEKEIIEFEKRELVRLKELRKRIYGKKRIGVPKMPTMKDMRVCDEKRLVYVCGHPIIFWRDMNETICIKWVDEKN